MNKVFYATINDSDTLGMTCISLVDSPAVEVPFLCFNKEEAKLNLSANKVKKIITGCAIRANKPIYRFSKELGEYYIIFNEETIQKMVERYSENKLFNIVSLQHNGKIINDVILVEMFIKDVERGIDPIEFKDVEDKSLFVSYKINDDELWNEIINGNEINGFSIECLVNMIPANIEMKKEDEIEKIIDEILEDK